MLRWSKELTVREGAGRIELRGLDGPHGLYVDGKPVALHWSACSGSVGMVFYRIGTLGRPPTGATLAHVVEDGRPASPEVLEAMITPLLSQFPTGIYRVSLDEIEEQCWVVNEAPLGRGGPRAYYPLGRDYRWMVSFLPTQNALDRERVAWWEERILSGSRPFAITARRAGANSEYILDGHHKLAAYLNVGQAPWRLGIEVTPRTPITRGDWPRPRAKPPWSWRANFGG